MKEKMKARLWDRTEEYQKLGMKPGAPEVWEDGVRTDGKKGEYEWWYFDSKLNDGSNLVIVFYTTPMVNSEGHYAPYATLNMTFPDGTEVKDRFDPKEGDFSFAKDHCCAQIGKCLFEGDLHDYTIHYESEKVTVDVTLSGNVPAWRTGTGHIFFGEKDYFAWIPAVPEGNVEVVYTDRERTGTFSGTGYHDHNWGNTAMFNLMHHWYWGRCKVGDYQIISSFITAEKKYDYAHFTVFMMAKDGEIISENDILPKYEEKDLTYDEVTGKHYFKNLVYDYDDGGKHYRVTYQAENLLEKDVMVKKAVLRGLMRLKGLNPTYNRFTGTAVVERIENEKIVEKVSAPALWELMYFGLDKQV
ncbi:MAG: hypothetical protein ACI4TF_04335 [Oliverpabstia sp.]